MDKLSAVFIETAYPSEALEFDPVLFTCLSGVRVVQCCQITCLRVFSSVLRCPCTISA